MIQNEADNEMEAKNFDSEMNQNGDDWAHSRVLAYATTYPDADEGTWRKEGGPYLQLSKLPYLRFRSFSIETREAE